MQYGYFDDENNEYIITRPDTPKAWSNYLGNTNYGAIITNNAGGYSFYKSGGMGRFMRLRFNSVPMDQPGRYVYLHDTESKDFWSTSWQPSGKDLEKYKTTCQHGLGYTKINSNYSNILSETCYYVPLGKTHEVWHVKITNKSKRKRTLKVFSYLEYAANWNAIDDLLNLQYVQYISKMEVVDGIIDHGTNVNIPEMSENFKEKDQGRHTFQALGGIPVSGYDTDREAFIGSYRTYANPISVEQGKSGNSLGYGDNPCGSLSGDLELQPGETKKFAVLVGIGKAAVEGKKIAHQYANLKICEDELKELKAYWLDRISGFKAQTPDKELNSTINTWGIYNAMLTYSWSRAASLIYSGIDRDGLGYRDSVQDLLGVMHAIPEEAKERLELLLSGQESTGGAKPVIFPFSHSPGKEKQTPENEYRSDDALWLFNAVPAYVKETGDIAFFNKTIPYSNAGSDTVFKHLRKAIEFSIQRSGKNGLPCGLMADWNDCLKFGHDGESVFVAMQLRFALKEYKIIGECLNESSEVIWASEQLNKLDNNLNKNAWNGQWFLRGFRYDGLKFGDSESAEGKFFLNPQVWAIISGLAEGEKAKKLLAQVEKQLATPYGLKLCTPPYESSDYNIVRAQLFNPGLKENGGIFIHTQAWGVMAEAILGNGNKAYEYLRSYLPAAYNEKAEIREIEPYVLCQSTHAEPSPKYGASRVPWLSGSATWTYYAITQYILGIRPEYDGLTFAPCIPADWQKLEIKRNFRGKELTILITNYGSQNNIKEIYVNKKQIISNYIPFDLLQDENTIEIVLKN